MTYLTAETECKLSVSSCHQTVANRGVALIGTGMRLLAGRRHHYLGPARGPAVTRRENGTLQASVGRDELLPPRVPSYRQQQPAST